MPALAKPSDTLWPRKCLKLEYRVTEAARAWAKNDPFHRSVSVRDIMYLERTLKKDMLKDRKPVPVPYLYNAAGIAKPGYSEYDPGLEYARTVMERQGEDVVRVLLWAGANPNEAGMYKRLPLMRAVKSAPQMPKVSPGIVRQLLAAGADPNLRDVNGWTALMFSAETGATDIAKQLLKNGARTDYLNCAGQSAADIARRNKHPALAKLLTARK
jgi:ankyrin repeat protein